MGSRPTRSSHDMVCFKGHIHLSLHNLLCKWKAIVPMPHTYFSLETWHYSLRVSSSRWLVHLQQATRGAFLLDNTSHPMTMIWDALTPVYARAKVTSWITAAASLLLSQASYNVSTSNEQMCYLWNNTLSYMMVFKFFMQYSFKESLNNCFIQFLWIFRYCSQWKYSLSLVGRWDGLRMTMSDLVIIVVSV